ncbi:MAG: DUF5682 family protein [Cyanophyceae cyanobacterium]
MSQSLVKIFGIRHHGPGSARSLVRSLQALQPDMILVEGPPDANEILSLLAQPDMKPPVALLIYAPDELSQAVYYPFAVFSPEWQALQYGLQHQKPVRFMDLPQTHQLAQRNQQSLEERPAAVDPLSRLAEAAGYSDSERWWEHMVEHRQNDAALFEAILEAMTALREEVQDSSPREREAQREAYMRRTIRQAQQEGFSKIAVVCGAWHGPALSEPLTNSKQDRALLKGLPQLKVQATWIPWTYERLSSRSGYGAGIESPGWYHHLWKSSRSSRQTSQTTIRWMTQVARLLRQEDLDASSASVIEAVRLAEALAALRHLAIPGLEELNEAAQTVLCFGEASPMTLIYQQLIVSDRLGQVPAATPLVPLQQDLQRLQKRLRLKPEANERLLTLDLRQPRDRERSQLLHRLLLLNIGWGTPQATSGKGTFKEGWQLRWQPELSLAAIEAGRWGNTVAAAAGACAHHRADAAPDLPPLTQLLERVLLAALPEAIAHLISRLQAAAAVANEVTHLMAALPPLVNILRYRDVRQTDSTVVTQIVDGLVVRICIGLPGACASLDDEAAATKIEEIDRTHSAIKLLQHENHAKTWSAVLLRLCDRFALHGLVAGRCCRLLLDEGSLTAEVAARKLGLALSLATDPPQAAAWIEGFLQGSGLLLLHDEAVWQVLDDWVTELTDETFIALLPLLRRTFSTFSPSERRQMGERVRVGAQQRPAAAQTTFAGDRARTALPLVAQLLGLQLSETKP